MERLLSGKYQGGNTVREKNSEILMKKKNQRET